MTESVSFFLPTRKGSKRVRNKNVRPFAGIQGGLVELKLGQLLGSKQVREIVLSTNDEECIRVAQKLDPHSVKIRIDRRPENLCRDDTVLDDLIRYVPRVISNDHILWGHVTTPFVNAEAYDRMIMEYFAALGNGFDSLVGVERVQNFFLDGDGKLMNTRLQEDAGNIKWPRTQDLQPVFEVNHTVFLCPKNIYVHHADRLGSRPFLHEMEKIESIDIDWEEDFQIAESIYRSLGSK